ncbi:MAG: hypothetical protein ACR2QM_04055 [Longimicrobiales bacterium]
MAKQSFTSVGHKVVRDHEETWPRIRGGLMSIHLLTLTTAVVLYATGMLSAPGVSWSHTVLAVLLVPLTLATTRHIVRSSHHPATQLQLASGMSLITLGVLLDGLGPSAWPLVTCLIGGTLLLRGRAIDPGPPATEGVSSIGR